MRFHKPYIQIIQKSVYSIRSAKLWRSRTSGCKYHLGRPIPAFVCVYIICTIFSLFYTQDFLRCAVFYTKNFEPVRQCPHYGRCLQRCRIYISIIIIAGNTKAFKKIHDIIMTVRCYELKWEKFICTGIA